MTTDITAALRRAAAGAEEWSRQEVRRVLAELVGAEPHRSLDWDEDAGEAWARVVDDYGVVALVSAQMPLVVIRSAADPPKLSGLGAEMVTVAAIEEEQLSADKRALIEVFPALEGQLGGGARDFSPEHFAAEDLWFLTV